MAVERARPVAQHDPGLPPRPARVRALAAIARAARSSTVATRRPRRLRRRAARRRARPRRRSPASSRRSACCTATSPSSRCAPTTRPARLDGVRVPSGIPKPLTEAQVTQPARRRDRQRADAPPRPGAARAALRHRCPHLRGRAGCRWATSTSTTRWCACSARGRRSASCRSARRPRPRSTTGSRASGRPHMVPLRWKRRGDAEAVFLNQQGGRLSRQGAWLVIKQYGERAGHHRSPVAARAAALLRHPPARPRRRPADRAGDARPRLDLDDPGVHQGQPGAAVGGLPVGPPAGRTGGQGDEPAREPAPPSAPPRGAVLRARCRRRRRSRPTRRGPSRTCCPARSGCGGG